METAASSSPVNLFGSFQSSPEYPVSVGGKSGSPAGSKFVGSDFVDIPDSPPSVRHGRGLEARILFPQPIVISDDEDDSPAHGDSPVFEQLPPSPQDIVSDLQSFDDMIENLAAKFWDCQHCLGMGHQTMTCTNRIRCRNCFRSGHIKRDCTGQPPNSSFWVPKVLSKGFGARAKKDSLPTSSVSPNQTPPPPQKTPIAYLPPIAAKLANNTCRSRFLSASRSSAAVPNGGLCN